MLPNYNLATALTGLGWNGTDKVVGTCTINAGVYVYGTTTGVYGFRTGVFPAGSSVTIVNNGEIHGKGGAGGAGNSNVGAAGGPCPFTPKARSRSITTAVFAAAEVAEAAAAMLGTRSLA